MNQCRFLVPVKIILCSFVCYERNFRNIYYQELNIINMKFEHAEGALLINIIRKQNTVKLIALFDFNEYIHSNIIHEIALPQLSRI